MVGQWVTVCGAVTAVLNAGFYLQSTRDDDDARTSEGLFVAAAPAPAPGQHVLVRGRVRELDGNTELHGVESIQTCGDASIAPVRARFEESGLEALESMWVSWEDPWFLADAARLGERGSVRATPGLRAFGPEHVLGADPRARVLWNIEGAHPAAELRFAPRERLGARAEALTGIVRLDGERPPALLLTASAVWEASAAGEPAPRAPGALRVASLNLHNYFAELGSLGAASELELRRQRDKLVAALSGLDADVIAVTELGAGRASLTHLADGLNGEASREPYAHDPAVPPSDAVQRAALLYRPTRVRPAAAASFLMSPAFRRPPLVQTFELSGVRLTIVVVHFKSKRCDAGEPAPDSGGCGAELRRAEAAELARWSAAMPEEHVLLIGDFNADVLEAPMLELERAGFEDLLALVPERDRYSYVYDGRATLLDHALASPALVDRCGRSGVWHINADELAIRDYRTTNPPDAYRADPYRSSDHDAIWVDLEL